MRTAAFTHDVFLSHSAKDKGVVRASSLSASNGERVGVRCRSLDLLRQDGVKVPFNFGFRISDFGFAKPCMSANAFGSDAAQLACPAVATRRRRKAGTCGRGNLPFRDPLNKERRFIPLRLDDVQIL